MSYRYVNGAVGTVEATTGIVGSGTFEQTLRGGDGQLVVAPALKLWSHRTLQGYLLNQAAYLPAESRKAVLLATLGSGHPAPAQAP